MGLSADDDVFQADTVPRGGSETQAIPAGRTSAADDDAATSDAFKFSDLGFYDLEDMVIGDDLRLDLEGDDSFEAAIRLRADRILLDELIATGFSGSLYNLFRNELARYGIDVLGAWIRSGQIARVCGEKGRLVDVHALQSMVWSRDELTELAIEAVAQGVRFFFAEVLKPGRWTPDRGATLKTFFVGACLLQFPNVYRRWLRESCRWRRIVDQAASIEELEDHALLGETDQTAEVAVNRTFVSDLVEKIADPQTRAAARVIMWGYTYAEAGERVGLTRKAVEGRFRRLRDNASLHGEGS